MRSGGLGAQATVAHWQAREREGKRGEVQLSNLQPLDVSVSSLSAQNFAHCNLKRHHVQRSAVAVRTWYHPWKQLVQFCCKVSAGHNQAYWRKDVHLYIPSS